MDIMIFVLSLLTFRVVHQKGLFSPSQSISDSHQNVVHLSYLTIHLIRLKPERLHISHG